MNSAAKFRAGLGLGFLASGNRVKGAGEAAKPDDAPEDGNRAKVPLMLAQAGGAAEGHALAARGALHPKHDALGAAEGHARAARGAAEGHARALAAFRR